MALLLGPLKSTVAEPHVMDIVAGRLEVALGRYRDGMHERFVDLVKVAAGYVLVVRLCAQLAGGRRFLPYR